jgi:ABC-type nitrate/sulfonate/bicarbonate transport system ATPase subunit
MLQIRRLFKQFDELTALADIDLAIDRGEIVGIVGTSGCGKSTLLRIVAGLEAPSAGNVVLDGVAVAGPRPEVGLVFQEPRLMPWLDVRANVEFALARRPRAQRRALAEAALARVGLAAFAEALPQQLSGGMAQRAALARALVNDPALLLLDEPLGKLDSLTRLTLQEELVSLWRREGFTAILVTHDVEEAVLLASRVIVLSDRPGRIKAEFKVERPYPRHRDDPDLVALRRQILGTLGLAT